MADIAGLIDIACLVGKWALAVQGTSLAGNELASFFLRHMLVAVIAAVIVVVAAVVVVGGGSGGRSGGSVGGALLGHVCQDIYVEEKAVSPCSM